MKIVLLTAGLMVCASVHSVAFAGPIDSPGGSKFLYLSTGPGSNPVGGVGDISGNATPDFDLATYGFSFTASGTDDFVADVNLLTSEYADDDPVADFWGVKIDGAPVGAFSPAGFTTSMYALVETNGAHTVVIPSFAFSGPPIVGPDGSVFLSGQTGWFSFMIPGAALSAGLHTLHLFIADDDDSVVDTALMVDNLRLVDGETVLMLNDFEADTIGAPPGMGTVSGNAFVAGDDLFVAPIPEPSTLTLAALGLFAGIGYARRHRS
ncbi:MAG: PEP-CTERM sorting domain-containing protein [Planctomycetaceae bacterium]